MITVQHLTKRFGSHTAVHDLLKQPIRWQPRESAHCRQASSSTSAWPRRLSTSLRCWCSTSPPLAAAISPAVVQRVMDDRVDATRVDAEALAEGMLGKPSEGSFGFVGDIGRLPVSFTELAQPGSLPAYTTSTARGVGMGWRGPYVNVGTSPNDYLTDSFGRAYTGAEASLNDTVAPFSFSNVPMGVHAIRVVKTSNPQAGTVVAQDTIVVRPSGTSAVELWF